MQQLLSCVGPEGSPCCEYPYTLSGADCVEQCLDRYYAEILDKNDAAWFVASKFGIVDASCTSIRRVSDILMMIDLLVSIFEEAEKRSADGLASLSMKEVWEANDLRCVADSMRRKHGLNVLNAFAMAGITDPATTVTPGPDIPVAGVYSCGLSSMPDPDGPEPPDPSCFINPDAVAEPLDCSTEFNAALFSGVELGGFPNGLYLPGPELPGYPGAPVYWLDGIPVYGIEAPTPGEYYWTMSLGDGFVTFPESSPFPWGNSNWHDTFGSGSVQPAVDQGTAGDICGIDILSVVDSGEASSNGLYFEGPSIPASMPGTSVYYNGLEFVYAESQVGSDFIWHLCSGSTSNVRYSTDVAYPDPFTATWVVVDGVGPAPTTSAGSFFDTLIPGPDPETIYSVTCCDEPLFAVYDSDSNSWSEFVFPSGFILQSMGILYVDIGNGPGMLFPSVQLTLIGPSPTSYYLESNSSQTAQGRTVRVQGYLSTGWTDIWVGNENTLPQSVEILGQVPSLVRASYLLNGCENNSPSTLTNPPPGGCGFIDVLISQSINCETSTLSLELSISNALAFPIGNVVVRTGPIVLQSFAGSEGIVTLGPYPSSYEVTVEVENAAFPECSYMSDPLFDPRVPDFQHEVYSAVDASYQPSAVFGRRYLIVSDDFGVGNTWAANVGSIVMNATFTVVADLEITKTETPVGLEAYWQMDSGTQVQVFPPVVFTLNTTTEIWIASPNPIAPFVAGTDISVQYRCGTGTPVVIYSGVIEGFVETIFDPPCSVPIVNGSIDYLTECPLNVPAVVVQFTPDGEVIEPFEIVGLNSTVNQIFPQPDGKFICVGIFTLYDATSAPYVTRLNADGSLDTTFNTNIGLGPNAVVRTAGIDSLGRVYIGGDFTSVDGDVSYPYIARILTDGTLDTSFTIGTSFNNRVGTILVQQNDKVVVLGDFTLYNGVTSNYIIRLNTDGSKDLTFNVGTGFNGSANAPPGASIIDPVDRSIIISSGAGFTAFNGTSVSGLGEKTILRINQDGTLNEVIAKGTRFDGVINGIDLQSDRKLVITGAFLNYNGSAVSRIIRLNVDGSIDFTFNSVIGIGFSATTSSVRVLPNGQILVGNGTNFQGSPTYGLTRLNANGSRDLSYNTGPGFNGPVTQTVIMPSGAILVSGNFTSFDGVTRIRVCLLN